MPSILTNILNDPKLLTATIAALIAALLAAALIVLWTRARRERAALRTQLARQTARVEARREKILTLRRAISLLLAENTRQRQIIADRGDKQEMQECFGRITDLLLQIYQRANSKNEIKAKKNNRDFRMLTEQLARCLGVENRSDLPWSGKAKRRDNAEKDSRSARYALIVDDNQSAGTALARMLEAKGYRAERADSGEQADEMFLRSPEGHYSFIFMDIVLKGISGYDTAREIRRSCRSDSERVPIIAMTANDFPEDLISIQNAGMNERLLKPITEEKVAAVLKKWRETDEAAASREGAESIPKDGKAATTFDDTWVSLTPQKAKTGKSSVA